MNWLIILFGFTWLVGGFIADFVRPRPADSFDMTFAAIGLGLILTGVAA